MASDYIKVYTGNLINTQCIVTKLKNIGILAVVKDESESGRLGGFASSMNGLQEIFVHQDEFEKAISLVHNTITES